MSFRDGLSEPMPADPTKMILRPVTGKYLLHVIRGVKMSEETIFMPCAEVERFAAAAFRAAGVPEKDAELCARILIAADRRGVSSHGIGRITGHYLDRIRNGTQQAVTNVEFVRKVGATCVIDGHHGMGMVIADAAMRYAMKCAKEHGIGIAVVRNSTHFGIAGYYTELAAKNGMIGICGTNARPAVAPTFSTENMLGTNPLAWAMPSDDPYPFSFDGATCVAPQGKIELYERLGKTEIPSGWVVGEDGNYRTDLANINADIPRHKAALVPIGGVGEMGGGHKGYGLSMIVELMSCALQQGAFLSALSHPTPEGKPGLPRTGHFFIAIDIGCFTTLPEFRRTVSAVTAELRAARKAPGCDRIYTPGEKAYLRSREVEKTGIGFSSAHRKMMHRVNREYGLNFELPFPED